VRWLGEVVWWSGLVKWPPRALICPRWPLKRDRSLSLHNFLLVVSPRSVHQSSQLPPCDLPGSLVSCLKVPQLPCTPRVRLPKLLCWPYVGLAVFSPNGSPSVPPHPGSVAALSSKTNLLRCYLLVNSCLPWDLYPNCIRELGRSTVTSYSNPYKDAKSK
jgi:hypothetical protein